MKIAFLGTGLMGTGFVRRMLAQGHEVAAWNRSADKARALEAHGARACASAADAVRGVERVHLMLADDAVVDAVLEPLADAIPAGAWIFDHTTTATTPTAERAARWKARGRRFLHAPVFMGPQNCVDGTGIMLLAGERARCDEATPMLAPMTGKVVWLGEAPERAASFKLFGNLTLIGMAGVLGDVARLASAVGIEPADAFSLYSHFNPGASLPQRAARVASGPYEPPSFEVAMARKDVRLMIEEAKRHGIDLAVMPSVAALFDAAIARGEGAKDSSAAFRWPQA
ncbi:MAG TPA: NAD(P)-binding domain-containing protein [Burkholderiaceae bacterium]|nr:NAD(P)-binding domain-containing protein [Burkholderiaceae bacterium]